MEKVWDELKKIETQAERIKSEAQNKAETLTSLAQQEAEKLIENGKTYAQEEAQQYYVSIMDEANRRRDKQLEANRQDMEKLKVQAEKHIEQASSAIVNSVLGETKL